MSEQEQRTITMLHEAIEWIASVAEEGYEHSLVKDMSEHIKEIETKLVS